MTIGQDQLVTEAVEVMLKKQVKRLPVVDAAGRLVGILSRVDVFRTSMRDPRTGKPFRSSEFMWKICVSVADIMRQDTSDGSSGHSGRGSDSPH